MAHGHGHGGEIARRRCRLPTPCPCCSVLHREGLHHGTPLGTCLGGEHGSGGQDVIGHGVQAHADMVPMVPSAMPPSAWTGARSIGDGGLLTAFTFLTDVRLHHVCF